MEFPMYCCHSAFQGDRGTCSLSSQPPLPVLPASIVAAVADPDILHLITVKHVYWLGTV